MASVLRRGLRHANKSFNTSINSRKYTLQASSTSKVASVEPLNRLPPILVTLHEAKARKATLRFLVTRPDKGLSFDSLAKTLGRNEIYVASIFYGHAKPTQEDIVALAHALAVDERAITDEIGSHWWPNRGLGGGIPSDPVIYRLYEGVIVYGHPIKAVIHEKFGDGIMSVLFFDWFMALELNVFRLRSMIDCKVNVDRKPDPKGDRVVITFDGKFLPYSQN
ncbi:Cyanate hydratase {ECO:0000255/HAMAP-Rule:MF_03139} Short=Cyanase {ECO:0000255/HAMAP-Rule:MF_03139}; {ECO:0000255/HAMAP-Rule:MF_03139}; AltName: Full=Cyanate hydrolase {ECO:0000255/HAMAP-Rule:MF_03139}; AltName: Full=Cyanate lyase {ECO:0000255/HAMAP-Rule:MF_03139} [Serendipita indica DSM 11827]|nr:Cyanate hydratase {ECO:0000255/HAMAP-Rule:MF_03139} Short=Cyanase {ECO:0000255/HAMAP-Rule:MF_03139}; {ECO:0000255/HAMAP-Rule:MF_03139}; AltName: Full=Cyanate hydrolase {ECO:0000255/HAMAP-Rule:MF_03139}; AltName: Full=Cyanate lyase {ECO:0000255/HAMAP-Rule:MF_03139} [Serendipita indica DSM 11827]